MAPRQLQQKSMAMEKPRGRAASARPHALPAARARRDRGAETRAELIDAALDVFGRLGFEGASTRMIATAAGANLAAIVYHFGGKEALYLAVAEHVAHSIFQRVGPAIAGAATPAAAPDAAAAHAALDRLIDTFVEVILGSADAEKWARFIIREQLQPTTAFEVIYRFMSRAAETATHLAAVITGERETDELKLRAITIMGQVLIFRVAQTFVLRRMDWRSLGDRQRREIKAVVKQNLAAILARRAP